MQGGSCPPNVKNALRRRLYCKGKSHLQRSIPRSVKGTMNGEPTAEGLNGTISADEFQALEAKVLQAVEMIRREREARAAVEAERNAAQGEVATLHERLRALEEANSTARTELETYHHEREAVRGRVERLLAQMDELL